jgi:hypothetical protein
MDIGRIENRRIERCKSKIALPPPVFEVQARAHLAALGLSDVEIEACLSADPRRPR